MNILGISFDFKLQWQTQVQNAINKSKKALQAIFLIRKIFTKEQLLKLLPFTTSCRKISVIFAYLKKMEMASCQEKV